MTADPYGWIDNALNTIHQAHWHRSTAHISELQGVRIVVDGQALRNFAGNDYLNLAQDPRLAAAAIAAIQRYGTGSTGSRLVTGHRPIHSELEAVIATFKGMEDALVFSSGFAANFGAITALVDRRDLILADRYNHASLQRGAIASGAKVCTYLHNDMADLRQQLEQVGHQHRRRLIATDTVFSMDGDLCRLPEIMAIAAEFDCMVLIDDAHGTGVLGATGAGAIEHFQLSPNLIEVGTLSKALGSLGGYVAGSQQLIDFLRNRCASWIYTTALSPADTAAALAAIAVIQSEPARQTQLWRNIQFLKNTLNNALPLGRLLPSDSAILCWELPSAAIALDISAQLRTQGIFAPAIRPPTVPTSRIRLTLSAGHEIEDLEALGRSIQSTKTNPPTKVRESIKSNK
jgi:8-amino-7-oxononanoate synthase